MATLTQKQFQENLAQTVRRIEQQQFIGYWAKSKGINLKTIEKHKQIDDVILMLKYKDTFGPHWSKSQAATWGGIWSNVYIHQKAIRPKMLKKLETIGLTINQKLSKIRSIRQTQAHRDLPTQNPSCNMTANDLGTTDRSCMRSVDV